MALAIPLTITSNLIAIYSENAKLDMSNEGIFGFLRKENIPLCLLLNGLVSGIFCGFGDTIAAFFNPSLLVMNATFLCPVIG